VVRLLGGRCSAAVSVLQTHDVRRKGFVESKLRQLINKLDQTPRVKAFPYPKSFGEPTEKHPFCEQFFIALDIEPDSSKQIDLSSAVLFFKEIVMGMSNFPRSETMGIDVVHYAAHKLPAFVFRDERRPPKPVKKNKRKAEEDAAGTPAKKPEADSAAHATGANLKAEDAAGAAAGVVPAVKADDTAVKAEAVAKAGPMPAVPAAALPDLLKMESKSEDLSAKVEPLAEPDAKAAAAAAGAAGLR
jgi:hypothetical protein